MALTKLHKRILSALVMAPLTVTVIILGGWYFAAFLCAGLLISLYEWYGLAIRGERIWLHLPLGVVYLLLSYALYFYLRFAFDQGAWLALSLMLAVWASDIGAYLLGKNIGGPKMAPQISPNKTWSGFVGALNGGGLAFVFLMFFGYALEPWLNTNIGLIPADLWAVFIAGMVIGAVGQAGDLLVSIYKRRIGAKDSGVLIPGHGGLLDRIDALLLAVPAFVMMVILWLM